MDCSKQSTYILCAHVLSAWHIVRTQPKSAVLLTAFRVIILKEDTQSGSFADSLLQMRPRLGGGADHDEMAHPCVSVRKAWKQSEGVVPQPGKDTVSTGWTQLSGVPPGSITGVR